MNPDGAVYLRIASYSCECGTSTPRSPVALQARGRNECGQLIHEFQGREAQLLTLPANALLMPSRATTRATFHGAPPARESQRSGPVRMKSMSASPALTKRGYVPGYLLCGRQCYHPAAGGRIPPHVARCETDPDAFALGAPVSAGSGAPTPTRAVELAQPLFLAVGVQRAPEFGTTWPSRAVNRGSTASAATTWAWAFQCPSIGLRSRRSPVSRW